jgi:hypothetical protein
MLLNHYSCCYSNLCFYYFIFGPVEGSCEHGNEPSGSIKAGVSWVAAQLAASQEGLSSMSEWYLVYLDV